MKHVDLFNDFLKDTVNLNSTRVAELEKSTDAIMSFVSGSAWEPKIVSWMAQGSWAHKTIIKPTDSGEFDADLLVFVKPVESWGAEKYIDTIYDIFANNGTYKDMVRRWSHCVTITYKNDKKIDVAPCIVDRLGFKMFEVCNRNTKEYEATEPVQYTSWLIQQNAICGNNTFRKVTRLFKYMRDIKTTFTCPSVLLTTLLGYRISAVDKDAAEFSDTPTALKTMFGRLDTYLQTNTVRPSVTNPYLPSEDFASGWTDTQYTNFRNVINRYRGWIDEAYEETARYESIAKWRRVFGDEFAADVVIEEARSISKTAIDAFNRTVTAAAAIATDAAYDLVALVKSVGIRALPNGFNILPHMHRPRWRRAATQLGVIVKANLYQSKESNNLGPVQSMQVLQPGRYILFTAVTNVGLPFGSTDFDVRWRVTNTDAVAAAAGQLRGEFYKSDEGTRKWEHLAYRGVHIVEAFVILKRTNQLAGISDPFYVVIE